MNACRKFAAIGSIAALGISFSGLSIAADIYKWFDENGVRHYSDSAPEDRKSEKMESGLSKLTVIPMPRFVAPAPRLPVTASRGVEHSPAALITLAASEEAKLAEWRVQCIVERWVDCDDRRALYARYGTMADWGHGPRGGSITHRPKMLR